MSLTPPTAPIFKRKQDRFLGSKIQVRGIILRTITVITTAFVELLTYLAIPFGKEIFMFFKIL